MTLDDEHDAAAAARHVAEATTGDDAAASVAPPALVQRALADDRAGDVVDGQYALVRAIGSGGYGEVWEARRLDGGQRVALKYLRASFATMPEVVRRFDDEVKAAARLEHPHIVRVFDIGREPASGRPYLVMEYVEGVPLSRWLTDAARPGWLREALVLFAQLLGALGCAHARGIVHRDLKPENVLVLADASATPRLKLLDFGVARIDPTGGAAGATASIAHTRLGVAVGTVPYMSPEQVSGDSSTVGPATDLFAVGVMLYELLSGRLPFVGNAIQTMYAITTQPVPRLDPDGARLRGVPFELLFLVYELLQKRPEQRPELAADVRQRLAAVLARMPDGAALATAATPLDETPADDDVPASLRVLAWRDPPLLGRDALRARLLGAVLDVNREQAPRCLVLGGAAGHGKRRLARWLHELVHERGYMRRVRVQRITELGLDRALQAALQLALRTPRFERESLAPRVEQALRLQGDDLQALCDFLLAPSHEPIAPAQQQCWRAVATRALFRMSDCPQPRPLLIWLEGAHSDALDETFAWTSALLRAGREAGQRILVVLPVDDEELDAHPGPVAAFCAAPEVERLEVPPLDDAALRALARAFVPELVEAAVEVAVAQSAGSPRRLRRILLDWVGRQALSRSAHGLELREPLAAAVIDDAVALQIRAFVEGAADEHAALRGLCALSLLGGALTWPQARAVLAGTGLDIEQLVAGHLLVAGSAEVGGGALGGVLDFADRDVVAWLRNAARDLDDLERLQRRCFALRARSALQAMSRGDWVMAGVQASDAFRLLDEMERAPAALRLVALDLVARLAALQRERGALSRHAAELERRAGSDAGSTRMRMMAAAELWFGWRCVLDADAAGARRHLLSAHAFAIIADDAGLMGRAQLRLGLVALELERDAQGACEALDLARTRLEAALAQRAAAREAARGGEDDDVETYLLGVVLADALVYRAEALAALGRFAAAHASVQRALEHLEALGDVQGQVRTSLMMARLLRQEVEAREGAAPASAAIATHLERARALLSRFDDRRARALLAWEGASLALAEERFAQAEAQFEEAAYSFAMVGDRRSAGHCRNVCGVAARLDGRLDAALEHLEQARDAFEREAHERGLGLVETNLGWLHLQRGEHDAAAEAFEAAIELLEREAPTERVAAMLGHAELLGVGGALHEAYDALCVAGLVVRAEFERGEPLRLGRDASASLERMTALGPPEARQHFRAVVRSLWSMAVLWRGR